MAVTVASITAEAIIARLTPLANRAERGAVVAFDADGTLWTGDVSDDVFLYSTAHGLLRSSARPALVELAERHGVHHGADATSSDVARALFAAHREGTVSELDTYAMMAWCYAGFARTELHDLAEGVLRDAGLRNRVNHRVAVVLEWASQHGLDAWIVSASPLPILEVAVQSIGLRADALVAAEPAFENDRILPHLMAPVPYADTKVAALRERTNGAELVAAFGDSQFDLAMLRAATFGVAVNPKAELRSALADRPELAILI